MFIMTTISAASATELFRQPPHGFVTCSSGEIAYRTVGQGPDVVLVHGWPLSGATYRGLLPHLTEHVTCHIIDLPGAGQSRFDDGDELSVANQMDAVRTFLDGRGLDDVAVVGNDVGGLVIRHALAGDPRVRGMGLIGTEQPQGISFRFKFFLAGRAIPGFGSILGWLAGQPRFRRIGLAFGDIFYDRDFLDGQFEEFFLHPLTNDPALLAASMRTLESFDVADVLALGEIHSRIGVPVRLVWGEHDKFFPVQQAREMVSTFPNAELVTIADAGLLAHEERPEEVAKALLPILT